MNYLYWYWCWYWCWRWRWYWYWHRHCYCYCYCYWYWTGPCCNVLCRIGSLVSRCAVRCCVIPCPVMF